MAKRKSLMDALSEYQEKNEFGRAQKKEEREKKASKNAAKAKTNTKTAFSTKQFMATDKVKPGATHRRSPSAPPPVRSSSSSGGGTSKPKSSSGSSSSSSGSTNKGKPMPSNPQFKNITMKPRKKRPGTGRTGEAAAKAANREGPKPKNEHKETKRKVNRRGRRVR